MSDQYPTVREVMEGASGVSFPAGAAHDPVTGMYTAPEPESAEMPDMVKDEQTGLFLPKPNMKVVTRLHFDTGMTMEVSESYETVRDAVAGHKSGDLLFSGPVFPDDPVLIRSAYVKRIVVITVDYRDLKQIELTQRQNEYNMKMAARQMGMSLDDETSPHIPTVAELNRNREQRRNRDRLNGR